MRKVSEKNNLKVLERYTLKPNFRYISFSWLKALFIRHTIVIAVSKCDEKQWNINCIHSW